MQLENGHLLIQSELSIKNWQLEAPALQCSLIKLHGRPALTGMIEIFRVIKYREGVAFHIKFS